MASSVSNTMTRIQAQSSQQNQGFDQVEGLFGTQDFQNTEVGKT
jgi:hypothetical protein